jgi:hypothetical protein
MASSFPQFMNFPPEIRHAIWSLTLPPLDDPAWAVYTRGWDAQFKPQAPGVASPRIASVQVPTPTIVYVCREARDVVVAWAAANKLEKSFRRETGGHVYERKMDLAIDRVYVPVTLWDRFCNDIQTWDAEGRTEITAMGASIVHLALPAYHAFYNISALGLLTKNLLILKDVSVVWGEELPQTRKHGSEVQPRYEFEDIVWLDGSGCCTNWAIWMGRGGGFLVLLSRGDV